MASSLCSSVLWCCDCVKKCCQHCCQVATFGCGLAVCSCIFGMTVMMVLFCFYYFVFFPTTPSASLEHTDMYDYVVDTSPVLKREVADKAEDVNQDYYYYLGQGDSKVFRRKRNLTTPPEGTSARPVRTVDPSRPSAGSTAEQTPATPEQATSQTSKPSTSTPYSAEISDEYEPDFHLSSTILDSVFNHAERSNLKESLGLCRKNVDIKVPEFKASLFPAEQAADILSCVNDLLKNQTKKQICVQLDPEMDAYLRWLVLTGEPKEKHKPVKIDVKEDFLFPPTPCAMNLPQQSPHCLTDHA